MCRLCALLLAVGLVGLAASQDAPGPAAVKEEKKSDPKAVSPKPSDEAELDVQKTTDRIAENAQRAGDRLKAKDPGADTRKIQQDIVKDIDALIKKAQQPPPPHHSDMSPMPQQPMGGMGEQSKSPIPKGGTGQQSKSPMGGSGRANAGQGGGAGSKPGRRPRRERRPRGDAPRGTGEPTAKTGTDPMPGRPDPKDSFGGEKEGKMPADGDRFGKVGPRRQDDKLGDLYKDVWGHLPDRLRQEMDLYYREKFMPRYSDLLRRYYAALAEQKKSGPGDR